MVKRLLLLSIPLLFFRPSLLADQPCSATYIPASVDSAVCISGTTLGAQPSGITPFPCSGLNNPDMWFKTCVPACASSLIVSLQGLSLTNALLFVYKGTCSNMVSLAGCNGYNSSPYFVSDTALTITSGDTVFIRIFIRSGPGTFTLCIGTDCVTGLPTHATVSGRVNVIPNPARNTFTVTNLPMDIGSIALYDALGKGVLNLDPPEKNSPSLSVDAKRLRKGIYYLKIQTGNSSLSRKVVISN